jgi:hypothetical protein
MRPAKGVTFAGLVQARNAADTIATAHLVCDTPNEIDT